MAYRQDLLDETACIAAFKYGNKRMAEQLLTRTRPAVVRTTFGSSFSWNREVRREVSLLHLAAYWGWKDIAVCLVTAHNCSVMWKDDKGHFPLHYAAYNGHLEVVKYFTAELHCDPMDRNMSGDTPLHYACRNGHFNIVQYLISEVHCDPSCVDNDGNTPLHCACRNGHFNIVQYLINEVHCDPSCEDNRKYTPLHYACTNGHLNIAKYLISEAHCDPSCETHSGETPLHLACRYSHSTIIQYLISEVHCNPSCVSKGGSTPLHVACDNCPLNIVQYLISEALCDPSCEDNGGYTPLHHACICGNTNVVKCLLSTGRVNPLAEDIHGHTPLYYATGEYDIIKLFQPFVDCNRDFPVHTFTKLILTGDTGAGKTTIAQLIKLLADRANSAVAVDCVADVQRFTAGIIPHHIESELGNFVVYDFAGQQEYYSSHAAILEHVMRKSAAMFFCMIDLSKSIDNISQSLHYWLTFIDNACSTAEETSLVAIIGSHADQITPLDLEEKSLFLQTIAAKSVKSQRYVGCITMDCRLANTEDSCHLVSLLTNSQEAIAVSRPAISYYCHVLYAFLHTKLEVVGCSLQDLMSVIAEESDSILPNDLSVLSELLTTHSDKGLIIFINNSESSSWVVANVEALLNEIDGTLFAPPHFKEYRNLASNTGIVPTSNLHNVFPLHNLEMVIGVLVSLEFCRPVDPSALQYTNLQTTTSYSSADLLFFPGLVQSERLDSLTLHGTLQFGWCLGCLDSNQFFGSCFLHLLLLSVAYRFPLAARCSTTSTLCGLQRRCTVWKNGISWRDSDNITTVIELIDKNRWVLVAMSCSEDRPVEFAKLRSELISLVRCLQQERCQSLEVCECLISPSMIQRYPFDDLPDTDLFDIQDVADSMLRRKPSICSLNKDCIGHLPTQSLPFEPYHLISPSYVCQLFNNDVADQPVPVPLLQMVRTLCNQSKMKPLVYRKLRQFLDGLSIFAGRNPLEVAGLKEGDLLSDTGSPTAGGGGDPTNIPSTKEEDHIHSPTAGAGSGDPSSLLSTADLQSDVQTDVVKRKEEDHIHSPTAGAVSGDPSSILSIDDLAEVKRVLKTLNRWQPLGLELGLSYFTLERIRKVQREDIEMCVMEMLAAWLQQQDNVSERGVPSWEVLRDGLKNIDENKLASEIDQKLNKLMRHTSQLSSVPCSQHEEVTQLKEENLLSNVDSPTAAGAGDPSSILSACRCCLWIILMLVVPVLLAVVAGFYLLY